MKKYLAVITDSFREALASRVLWILLILTTILLFAFSPLGYREEVTWRLGDSDVRDWFALMDQIRKEGSKESASPSHRIWALFDEKLRKKVSDVRIPGKDQEPGNPFEFMGTLSAFQGAVNKLIERPGLYDEASWRGVVTSSPELRELREGGVDKLRGKEVSRFHRLLLEAAFPNLVRSSPPTSIQFTYAGRDVAPPQPLRGTTLRESIQSSAAALMKWFVGALGVFVAILATAPIIPQMFDPGSLHLLLSKPVARWLLFLAKFSGGCAFIFIGASYLIGGFWLMLGLRFGVWESKLLLSIPIYLFVFAIYYAVSSLAGVIWRSSVVSIGMTLLFFVACWLVGTAKVAFERLIWDKEGMTRVFVAKGTLIGVNDLGIVHAWDEKQRDWREIFVTDAQKQSRGFMMFMPVVPREFKPIGPVYDAGHDRLLSAQPSFPPGKLQICVAPRNKDWESMNGVAAPAGTLALVQEPAGATLAVSSLDLYRLEGDPLAKSEPLELFGVRLPFNSKQPFRAAGPDPAVVIAQPAAVAMNSDSGELALYVRGTITVLSHGADGKYSRKCETPSKGSDRQPAVLGFGGSTLLVGQRDGGLQALSAGNLETRAEFRPEGSSPPRFITVAPGGRWFAVVLHSRYLWLYDAHRNTIACPNVAGQGDISCADFTLDGELLVADRKARVSVYRLEPVQLIRRYAPPLGLVATAYRYGLVPLYTVFPKPGELDKTFEHFLIGKTTRGSSEEDLSAAQQLVDPWTPLWSSAAFMFVVLLAACVYIECQDY